METNYIINMITIKLTNVKKIFKQSFRKLNTRCLPKKHKMSHVTHTTRRRTFILITVLCPL